MNCRYCGTWNAEDDRRCERCGRRLSLDSAQSGARVQGQEATARALELTEPLGEAAPPPIPERAPQTPRQGTLFGPPPRVIKFPIAAGHREAPAAVSAAPSRREGGRRAPRKQ